MNLLKIGTTFWSDEEGAVVTEYAMLLALIFVVAILGVELLGTAVVGIWTGIMANWP